MINIATAELVDSIGSGIVLGSKPTRMPPISINGESKNSVPDQIKITHEYDTPEFLAKLLAHCHRAKQAAIRDDARSQM